MEQNSIDIGIICTNADSVRKWRIISLQVRGYGFAPIDIEVPHVALEMFTSVTVSLTGISHESKQVSKKITVSALKRVIIMLF